MKIKSKFAATHTQRSTFVYQLMYNGLARFRNLVKLLMRV